MLGDVMLRQKPGVNELAQSQDKSPISVRLSLALQSSLLISLEPSSSLPRFGPNLPCSLIQWTLQEQRLTTCGSVICTS